MSRNALASHLSRSSNRSGQRRKNSASRRFRRGAVFIPRMEALEERRLLAVTVGNESDVMNGDASSITALVANDGGDGISLREAITAANNTDGADVIDFAPKVNGTISLTNGQLDITDELTINGPGKDKLTVSGSGQSRVLDVTDTSLAIDQLTIANGFTTSDLLPPSYRTAGGAGIRATNSRVSLEEVVLEDNQVVDSVFAAGAAIQARDGSNVSLVHVTARNNEATGLFFAIGGAVQSDNGSTLTIEHSTFTGNRVVSHPENGGMFPPTTVGGGAIGISAGQTTISDSQFTNNRVDGGHAPGVGGAILNTFGSSLVVDRSSFLGNSVVGTTSGGGAIANNQGSSSFISDSRFVHNTAASEGVAEGGAISNATGGTMVVDRSWLLFNKTNGNTSHGGGVYNGDASEFLLTRSLVLASRATTDDGEANGGGVYNAGTMFVDKARILFNHASTSHDNVFGDLLLLDDVLALV